MEPEDVTQEPEPLSPSNRNRVHKVEPTNRSHNVQYLPNPHNALPDCQGSVPVRRFGSGSYTTVPRGLGSGVDPLGSASGVGKSSVSLVGVVFGGVGADEPAIG